jgi:HPt (histidine-containing phosphotransfer) domain-containing protein
VTGPQPTDLDESILVELVASVGDDRAFVDDLARTFLGDAAALVAAMSDAASAGDVEGVIRPAHTLKSSSATLGCERLASLARRIELTAREGTLDPSVRDGTLAETWDAASGALTAWLEGGES